MRYTILIEQTETGCSAYVPDLPGCVAAGDTEDQVRELMHKAITMHLEALCAQGEPVPEPRTVSALVEVA